MNNIVQIFFDTAHKFPEKAAIIHKGNSTSYLQLRQDVIFSATYFESKGVRKGTKVLVFVPMSINLYQTVLALFSLGAIVVFVDEWADRSRLRKALEVVHVDAIIAPRKYLWLAYLLRPFSSIKKKIRMPSPSKLGKQQIEYGGIDINKKNCQDVAKADTALITFTTGSTGLPKAADRSHGFLQEQFDILSREIAANSQDVCLVTLPIVLLSILGTGATGVVAEFNQKKPEKLNPKAQLELMLDVGVSMLIASPYYVDKLASLGIPSAKLRKILTGGAPVFPDLAERITRTFQKSECLVAYGSTEAEPISLVNMKDVQVNKYGLSVGKVNPVVNLKIIKITDSSIVLGEDGWSEWESDFGEIVVSGPHVLTRYHNSEEAFRLNKIVDGETIWHRTGDSGQIKNDLLYLNGRCSQLIKSKQGYKSLFLIEYQLSQLDGVLIGTYINDVVVLELNSIAVEAKVKVLVSDLELGERMIMIVDRIPRDPRHFSKIDYAKVLAEM